MDSMQSECIYYGGVCVIIISVSLSSFPCFPCYHVLLFAFSLALFLCSLLFARSLAWCSCHPLPLPLPLTVPCGTARWVSRLLLAVCCLLSAVYYVLSALYCVRSILEFTLYLCRFLGGDFVSILGRGNGVFILLSLLFLFFSFL